MIQMKREEAIGWLKIIDETVFGKEASNAIYIAIEALEEPEQKKAKWVKDKTNQLYCSACGQYGVYSEKFGTLHTLYCPYCGAKMEGEE